MKRKAIVDTTVLAYSMDLKQINLLSNLKNLFSEILIPECVRDEFDPKYGTAQFSKRKEFINNLKIDYGFYKLCTTKDPIVFDSVSAKRGYIKEKLKQLPRQEKEKYA
ncbi:hypothetical protein [Reichenbachiella sp. MALMAid0571]|uniref:hypothetical protein n=1 Tax=Reichenbachiella sp. MALMAid0571 TaxID=3143939 RepID=UPI0032DECCB4